MKFAINDIVEFSGNVHYSNSAKNASKKSCRPGTAKVTAIKEGKAHPYHLIHEDSVSNVCGWVNEADIKEIIKTEEPVVEPEEVIDSLDTVKYTDNNEPLVCMMTQSKCYQNTRKMNILGILWHSTGANNPTLKRYVQPDDDAANKDEWLKLLGENQHHNDFNHIDRDAGLNAWIGKLADDTVASVQVMPWDYRPWGCGSGKRGSCNSGWIQFEICEDELNDEVYFTKVYNEAIQLTAYLCHKFNIDPKGKQVVKGYYVPNILCHADSHKLEMGSNHGDVMHWFPKFGKSMETVRNDVAALLEKYPKEEVKKEEIVIVETRKEEIAATASEIVEPAAPAINLSKLKIGDTITLCENAHYASGLAIPGWVLKKTLYVRQIQDNKVVFSILSAGPITGTIYKNVITDFVSIEVEPPKFQKYVAQVNAGILNVKAEASETSAIKGYVCKGSKYTIIDESNGYGKLKSGSGWVSLSYIEKLYNVND